MSCRPYFPEPGERAYKYSQNHFHILWEDILYKCKFGGGGCCPL
uniref:Uncharacterized protein n=1 Tax=Anguilla anguilla TaxID=7936 RepID=A0A0E9V9H1_ANGAN